MILKNATIHVGNGEVFQGDMKIADGKIAGVGKELSGDEERDMAGREIFPGFIDSGNFLGTQDMAFHAKDYNENSSPITPHLDIWHSIDPDEICLQEFYKAGITSVVVTPGNEGILAGTCAVMKTKGRNINKMTVRRDVALKASMTKEVINVFKNKGGPKTPMSLVNMLKDALERTSYGESYREQRTKEVMDAVKAGRMPLLVACENVCEVERFMDATAAYPEMKIIITLSYEADRAAELIRSRNASVVLGDTSRYSIQLQHKINFAGLVDMAEKGTKFGLTVLGPDMAWGREMLLWNASKLMQTCTDSEMITRMLTENPAELFGVSDRVGMLKAGMDADYIIFEGNPIEKCGARLLETVINGETVYRA